MDRTMKDSILTLEEMIALVKPIAERYHVHNIYLFGSYARGEANSDSDLDFLIYGGESFKDTGIFALAEELREALDKDVDVFEIREINEDSELYRNIMKEKVLIA